MICLFLLLSFSTPQVVIQGEQADTFFQPKEITLATDGSFYVLAKDSRLFHISSTGQVIQQFGGKGQGPGQLNLPVAVLWIEETQSLWVGDAGKHEISIFKNATYVRSIKVDAVGSLLRTGKHVVLTPPDVPSDFHVLSPEGETIKRFPVDFVYPQDHYQDMSLWRSFEATALQDGRILVGYIWANKLSVIDPDGNHFRAWDMEDYYPEHTANRFPKYFSQLGAAQNPDGTVWVLTCSHATKSCQELLLLDYTNKALVGRAKAPLGLRKILRLSDGRLAIIEAETDTVKIYKDFPYPVKRKQ